VLRCLRCFRAAVAGVLSKPILTIRTSAELAVIHQAIQHDLTGDRLHAKETSGLRDM
jgi:hypothetical protein